MKEAAPSTMTGDAGDLNSVLDAEVTACDAAKDLRESWAMASPNGRNYSDANYQAARKEYDEIAELIRQAHNRIEAAAIATSQIVNKLNS